MDIKVTIKEHSDHKCDNGDETDQLLGSYNLPKLTQETNNLNRLVCIKETESITNNFAKQKVRTRPQRTYPKSKEEII